jgi:hypothetical protein
MAIDWSIAAVAVALAIFAAPFSFTIVWKVVGSTWAKSRRCICLKWEDVPVGRVHDCAPLGRLYQSCYHICHHERAKAFWQSQSSLACIFNRAWKLSEQRPHYIKRVPEELPSGAPFLCTDGRTVLVFVLCTVADRKVGIRRIGTRRA